MQARSLLLSSGLAAKLLVLLFCILHFTTAEAEHGHQRHPRQFGGRGGARGANTGARGGGGGAAQRPGGFRYAGPWHQSTWYSTLRKRFDEVGVDDDQGIHTEEFLDAAQSLPNFFDLLGKIAFRPARIDNEQNIQKIRNRFNDRRDNAGTLQRLVRDEKDNGVGYGGSASESLLWLSRTLDFTAKSLRKDLEDNRNRSPNDPPEKPLSEAFKSTYPQTLKQYHNDVQRALFEASFSAIPSRKTFYQRLAAQDSAQAAVEDTDKWVTALERISGILSGFIENGEWRW